MRYISIFDKNSYLGQVIDLELGDKDERKWRGRRKMKNKSWT